VNGKWRALRFGASIGALAAAAACGPGAHLVENGYDVSLWISGRVFAPGGVLPNLTLVRADREKDLVAFSRGPDGSGFLELAVRDFGNRPTTAPVEIAIFVDGPLTRTWVIEDRIRPGEIVRSGRIPVGTLAPGTHSVRVVIDPANRIPESMKTDNALSATIDVAPLP
jgi:hypothetical protein